MPSVVSEHVNVVPKWSENVDIVAVNGVSETDMEVDNYEENGSVDTSDVEGVSSSEPDGRNIHENGDTGRSGDTDDDDDDDDDPDPDGEYEVERLVDMTVDEKGASFFKVKWKGWHARHNTWEPMSNLTNCDEKIAEYVEMVRERDCQGNPLPLYESLKQIRILAAGGREVVPSRTEPNSPCGGWVVTVKPLKTPEQIKEYTDNKLKEFELFINAACMRQGEPQNIKVENTVDSEGPPGNFIYVTDYIPAGGVIIPNDPPPGSGCSCAPDQECSANNKTCCPMLTFNTLFAYNKNGGTRITPGSPIYECNNACACAKFPEKCYNRVVQKGRKIPLTIFRTIGKGWGVRTDCVIRKDTFVVEYIGEIIPEAEAERRGLLYDATGSTYLFDLDFDDSDNLYAVDATRFGNIAHFMNHSCDPNLVMYSAWINCLDPKLPRIVFFSKRDIRKGEELTFNYFSGKGPHTSRRPTGVTNGTAMATDTVGTALANGSNGREDGNGNGLVTGPQSKRRKCQCGAAKCAGYIFVVDADAQ